MNTKHLKAKILDLAIRGKLVPQDSSEGNAADLLKKIREEKNNLIEQKKIKAEKNSSFIIKADDGRHYEQVADGSLIDIEDDIPFEIPENWCWCRFCNCSINRDGERKPVSEKVRAKIEKKYDYIGATGPVDKINDFLFDETLLLVGEDGANLLSKSKDNAFIVTGKYWVNNHAHVIDATDKELLQYYKIYINAIRLDNYVTGSAQPKFTQNALNSLLIPLPPLSEQQRIVAAIEKAFEQIDIIEKNKLYLKTYIKQTKSKVLDLAIRGKLVEQNPGEGNAFELLEKIRKEKSELVKQKKIKEDKKSSFIFKAEDGKHYEQFADGTQKDIEDEIPFEIPENWCWCRLPEISNSILAGGDRPTICTKKKTSENNIPIYANAVDKEGLYGFTNKPQVTEKAITISARGTIGFTCIREEPFVPIVRLIVLVPNLTIIQLKYLKSTFDTLLNMTEGSSIPQLTIPSIKTFLFPLPPIEEQKRIIERIEQIIKQLDILEKALGE